jgi:hypothetical protein
MRDPDNIADVLNAPTRSVSRSRRRLGLVLAFALLFAQAGALLHVSSHAVEKRDTAALHTLCTQCLSFSTVLSIVPGSDAPTLPLALFAISLASALVAPLAARGPALAFRSRAPPSPR